ncbi:MAG: DUF4870 domain-containing protein [Chloroflexota bacterium]
MNHTPTSDDRTMAGLAHISAIMPMMGVIAPIIIWATQKEKSDYIAFHALQALGYQLTMILIWFGGMICYMLSIFTTVFIAAQNVENLEAGPPIFIAFPFLIFAFMFIGIFFFIVYGIWGAIRAFQGKPFKYFFIGNQVRKMQASQKS